MKIPFYARLSQNIPLYLQGEVSECGLACLAMIASYHGHEVNLTGLRQMYEISSRGSNLRQIIAIADQLGLRSRAVKLELPQLKDLKLPAILHWDLNHFVVLAERKGPSFRILNPASGEKFYTEKEISTHFTGVALELEKNPKFKPIIHKPILKISQFFQGIDGIKGGLFQAAILSAILLIMTMAIPILIQLVFDEVLVSYDQQLLTLMSIGVAVVIAFRSVTGFMRGLLTQYIGSSLSFHLSTSVYRQILQLPLRFFERRHVGDVMSRFTAIEPIRKFLSESLVEIFIDTILVLFTLVLMSIYSIKLALISVAAVIFYAILRVFLQRSFRLLTEEAIAGNAKQTTSFIETVRAIQCIKLYKGAIDRHTIWQNLYAQELNAHAGLGRLQVIFFTIKELIFGLEKVLIIYIGAKLVFDSNLSAGMLIAFLSYKDQFGEKFGSLIENVVQFKTLDVHLERLSDLVLQDVEDSRNIPEIFAANLTAGSMEIKGLGYRYDRDSPWIFRDLQLSIKQGEIIAIVGPSGCGKTSLLKIMVGLFSADEGDIFLDGHPIQQCRESYQQSLATVMQDDQLISGTILENIAFFDPNADLKKVVNCASMACIYEEIMKMPMNFNSLVGDLGSGISGGQKQRILLARALYRQPLYLFLDEATSHLDGQMERAINERIASLQMTRIIIAHRRETILSAHRIFELSPNGLIELDKNQFKLDPFESSSHMAAEGA